MFVLGHEKARLKGRARWWLGVSDYRFSSPAAPSRREENIAPPARCSRIRRSESVVECAIDHHARRIAFGIQFVKRPVD
jgi:hypothetical protein